MFYRDVSQATAGKLPPEKMDWVVVQLGRLLYSREITLKRYQAAIEKLRDSVFVSTQSDITRSFWIYLPCQVLFTKKRVHLKCLLRPSRSNRGDRCAAKNGITGGKKSRSLRRGL